MIDSKLTDGVLELSIVNPPVNALSVAVREGLAEALDRADADDAIRAVAIHSSSRFFSAGADITEIGEKTFTVPLGPLIERIAASAKPVVAAVHGGCLGGGFELALGCRYRVADETARFALPEVKLGLIPGAGGTQRLPRLIGVAPALEMILSGRQVDAREAVRLGIVDQLVAAGDLAAAAREIALAGDRAHSVDPLPIAIDPALFAAMPERERRQDANLAAIEAVRLASELPLAGGLAGERRIFRRLAGGSQSRALRYLFLAERRAGKLDDVPADTPVRQIERVCILGAGTMGGGIAMNFLSAGIPVTLIDTTQDAVDRGLATIRANYDAAARRGRTSPEAVERAMALLTPATDWGAIGRCDLVIEAVYEDMALKQDIFTRLDALAPPGAILATNTSYLDVDAIAACTDRPEAVVGLHFFSPANVMQLLEVVRGARTSNETLASAIALAQRIRKRPVVARVCYGFIGNRMVLPRKEQAAELLLEDASPEQVDAVHTRFGMPMGPFQMSDLAGVDIGWHRDPQRIESIRDALCAAGRWGQKTRAGYYDYDDRRRPTPSPVTQRIVEEFRATKGIVPREITDEEIIARTLYTVVNEGYRIVEEGIAQRASDVDVVWTHGYGWPRYLGGPMFWAGEVGAATIVAGLEHYRDRLGPDFVIAPSLLEQARAEHDATAIKERSEADA